MLRAPSMQDLSAHLADAARAIARRLLEAGHRAWIVGGAPRDLALGIEPKDVDLASDARPEDVERLFARTVPVGRAFGTVIVVEQGVDVQHTTFRSEQGYRDARRPDEVRFGASVAEDASRRDFTCNALYLDPLEDRVLDPEGGLADLEARRLATVGEPEARFREDGLRLLRLARFAAALDLALAPGLAEAAGRSLDALRGVSPERVLAELEAVTQRPRFGRAAGLLASLGILDRALPGWRSRAPAELSPREWERVRLAVCAALPARPGPDLGLAALLAPTGSLVGTVAGGGADEGRRALALADELRVSRARRRALAEAWEVARALADEPAPARRSQRVRRMRSPGFRDGLRLALASRAARGLPFAPLRALELEARALGPTGLRPEPWIGSAELAAIGIERGPRWKQLLDEAEGLQLDGAWARREDALAWLAARAQEGGKTPRSA